MDLLELQKIIETSQHCQRNWDLSKNLPDDVIQTLIYAGTICPSKQNRKFYKLHVITNRNLLNDILGTTKGFGYGDDFLTNPQVLANVLFVYEEDISESYFPAHESHSLPESIIRDVEQSIAISAAYINLTASLLGLKSGFCACIFDNELRKILPVSGRLGLALGVGYPDTNRPRNEHHVNSIIMPVKNKEPIPVLHHT